MTSFDRRGHYRTNAYGTTFWVSDHGVKRDDWNRAQLAANLRRADAISYLQRHAARTISGCFVTPNARCPVCREPVFFYANRFGSRVFFDELGPAWTKHPCTDNPKKPIDTSHITFTQLARRKTGERIELLKFARTAGFNEAKLYGSGNDQWHLLVVTSVLREKAISTVICECITASPVVEIRFKIASPEPVFDVGDFVNKRGGQFSFLHRDSMSVVSFRNGEELRLPDAISEETPTALKSVETPSPHHKDSEPVFIKKRSLLDLLTTSERSQLAVDDATLSELCRQLKPMIERLWSQKIRTPDAVSIKLNKWRYQTANGKAWTPRLAAVLLASIFGGVPRLPRLPKSLRKFSSRPVIAEVKKEKANEPRHPVKRLEKMTRPLARQPLTKEELAKRLAVLGRVRVSDD